ncbi:hypothetical protein CLPU_3c00200 [Gottschalkia purinilytica]|uniref:Uncharacterized protein n=1 Tax=Gottschalkia purinilytica TaxID=1503 RepID=A0A0L0WCP7_GOTPU|nr:hypothetical protein [Gottschalkia purinilytica]KNF09242.1 hypothetical protein CLPU_3c00200 [Gottschalkia purinilytica]
MSTAVKLWDIYKGLTDKFLYNNDLNSIYILLALYDIEENISNIYPKYMCLKDIKKKIKYVLKDREDSEIISHNLSVIMHEDINRLELCFYLEGYKDGYNSLKYVNLLEKEFVRIFGIEHVYSNNYLIHDSSKHEEIKAIRKRCDIEIDNKEKQEKYIENLTTTFTNKVIKKKVENLSDYVAKQLKIDFDLYNVKIDEVNYDLSDDEVSEIYNMLLVILIKHLKNTYKDAFWYAVNDKVSKRYS